MLTYGGELRRPGADGATTPPCAVTAVSLAAMDRVAEGAASATVGPTEGAGRELEPPGAPGADTAFFSSADIARRFLVGWAAGGVSATGVAVAAVRREEERRGAGFAGGAEVPAGSGRRGAAHGHAAGSTLAFPTTTGLQRASRLPADSAVVLARRPRRAFRRRAWTADWRGGGVGTWPATAGTHLARVDARRRRGRAARCATERRPRWVAAPSSPAPRRCPPRPERIYWVAGRAVSTC